MAKKSFIWIVFTIIILITLHLKMFTVADFDVPVIFVLLIIWLPLTFSFRSFSVQGMLIALILLILPLLYFPILYDIIEFIKTYAQYVISVIVFFLFAYRKRCLIETKDFLKAIQVFQVILLIITIIQFILVQYLGNDTFYNIWGEYQMYHRLERNPWVTVQRMKAFYLEPSYLAFVTINCYWYVLHLKSNFSKFNFFITLAIILLSASSFGLLTLVLLILHYFILKQQLWLQSLGYITTIFLIVIFWEVLSPYVKLDTLFNKEAEYTSTFMRLVAPLRVLEAIWNDGYIFGAGFGQYEKYYEAIIAVKFGEKGISNGIYLFLAYFGILGLLLYLVVTVKFFMSDSILLKSFILLCFLNFTNSGAIFTVQFVFLAFLLPMILSELKSKQFKDIIS